jgi:hypothetical protein
LAGAAAGPSPAPAGPLPPAGFADHSAHAFYWEVKAVRSDVEELIVEIAKEADTIPQDITRVNLTATCRKS